jgi:3-oxoadipate enol-lactonase
MHQTRRTDEPVAIAYDIGGHGPLVVFLHGIGGNRRNWEGQVDYFGARFCAVAWDARGYGASDDSPHPLRFRDYADDLARLLDHLDAARAHLVGLSMGGMILQDFYSRHPDRVATLSLVDTSVGFGSVSQEVRRDFLARRLEPLERGLTPADIAPAVVEVLVAKDATPRHASGCVLPWRPCASTPTSKPYTPSSPPISVPSCHTSTCRRW